MLDASDEGENFMERLSMRIPENAAVILKGLSEAGYEAYVVGGCVRDSLLGREPKDWDITTSARDEVRRINEEYEGKDLGLVLELVDDAAFTFAAAMTVHGTPDETSRLLKKHGLEDLAED